METNENCGVNETDSVKKISTEERNFSRYELNGHLECQRIHFAIRDLNLIISELVSYLANRHNTEKEKAIENLKIASFWLTEYLNSIDLR